MRKLPDAGRSVLNAREAASELGVCERTLRRYVAAGRIRHHRLPGGHIRIPVEAIDEFWAQHQRQQTRAPQRSGDGCDGVDGGVSAASQRGSANSRRRPRLDAPVQREYDLSAEHLAEIRARYTTK